MQTFGIGVNDAYVGLENIWMGLLEPERELLVELGIPVL